MLTAKSTLILFSVGLIGCFPGGSFFEQAASHANQENDVAVAITGDTTSAQVSVSSTVSQKISVPDDSSLNGASLSIPPGALTVNLTVSIEETVAITSLTADEEVEYASYAAMGVSNSAGVESLSKPMTIQIPLSDSSAFSLQDTSVNTTPNAVKLRISGSQSTSCKEVFILDDEFTIGLLAGTSLQGVTLQKEFFGSYQPLRVAQSLYDRVRSSRDEIQRRIAAGTATKEELLSAKSGCPIVTKTKKKELDTASPIHFAAIKAEVNGRSVILSAEIDSATALTSCSARMANKFRPQAEQLKAAAATSTVTFKLNNHRPPLSGSGVMSCVFADGRSVRKNFAKIQVNGLVESKWNPASRLLQFFTDLPTGGICQLNGYNEFDQEHFTDPVADPRYEEVDLSRDSEAAKVRLHFSCEYPDGSVLRTDDLLVEIEACASCAGDETAPEITELGFDAAYLAPVNDTIYFSAQDESAIHQLCFWFRQASSGFAGLPICGPVNPSSNAEFSHEANITFAPYLQPNSYDIHRIRIEDEFGNQAKFEAPHPMENTIFYKQYYREANSQWQQREDSTIMVASFSLAAGAGHNPDQSAPTFEGFLTTSGPSLTPGQPITISYAATDAGSSFDLNKQYVELCFDIKRINDSTSYQNICGHTTSWLGANQFETTFALPGHMQSGDYLISGVHLSDRAHAISSSYTSSPDGTGSYDNPNQSPVWSFTFVGGTVAVLAFDQSVESEIDILDGIGPSPQRTLTLRNIGNAPSNLLTAPTVAGNNPADFIVSANGCSGGVLMPGDSCLIEVQLNAADDGPYAATFTVGDGYTNSNAVQLEGSAYGFHNFISQWDSNMAAATPVGQIKLPLESTGTYDFRVDWGDGNFSIIKDWNDPAATHTYATAGVYTVTISGQLHGWRFNGMGDAAKITNISEWGQRINFGNDGGYFRGCTNLVVTALSSDHPDLSGTFNLSYAFADATSLTGDLSGWDVSQVHDFSYMFYNAAQFNSPLYWDTGAAVILRKMFGGATNFNDPSITSWSVTNVTDFSYMFLGAISFNQDLGTWVTTNATSYRSMFENASSFNQSVANFTVTDNDDLVSMFTGVTLSEAIYAATLAGFSTSGATNVSFDGGNVSYLAGSQTATDRGYLMNTLGWTILDGGPY